jgi:hypothetical protein
MATNPPWYNKAYQMSEPVAEQNHCVLWAELNDQDRATLGQNS